MSPHRWNISDTSCEGFYAGAKCKRPGGVALWGMVRGEKRLIKLPALIKRDGKYWHGPCYEAQKAR